jgi:hypothetical protein
MSSDDILTEISALSFMRALRALDAFDASVDPRVLADFYHTCDDPYGRWKEPMGLQRLRDKLNAQAYSSEQPWWKDVDCIFRRFDNDPMGSVRRRMAAALSWLLVSLVRCELPGRANSKVGVERKRFNVKHLEPVYIADQLARSVAPVPNPPAAAASPSAEQAAADAIPSASKRASAASRSAHAKQHKTSGDNLLATIIPASIDCGSTAAAALVLPDPQAAVCAATAAAASRNAPADGAASLAATMRESSAALLRYAEQVERDKAQLTQDKAQVDEEKEKLSQANGTLMHDKVQLQRQLNERTAELATVQSQIAAAAAQVTVKLEKLVDAQIDKHEEAAGKRKAIEEREGEAKRRRLAEAARDELTERNKQLQSALLVNPAARPDCSSCCEHPTSAVCLPCGHLVSCIECAEQWQSKNRTCPVCRRKVTKVVQTYLASDTD